MIFVFLMADSLGRKPSLFISALGMGITFFIIGAILKTHPVVTVLPGQVAPPPPPSSKAMAAMLYIYVCFYSMGWGPLPWVYVADIFPTRTRHYGLAVASGSQWLWSTYSDIRPFPSAQLSSRLCRGQSDAYDRSEPGLQAFHAVWRDQHWRHDCLFSVRRDIYSAMFSSADPLFVASYPRPRVAVWKRWISYSVPSTRRRARPLFEKKNVHSTLPTIFRRHSQTKLKSDL